MRLLSVVRARPQLVKLAPICRATAAAGVEHLIVHTGQHYDPMLSDVFFKDLEIPAPNTRLGVGSGSHGHQTGAILAAMDDVLTEHQPDIVLVYGDTNSTLAAALSAVRLHFPLVHLEAGQRSFNRPMPEEHNRVLTDHAADLCLAPTNHAMIQLASEGLSTRSVMVGDVTTDVLLTVREQILHTPASIRTPADVRGDDYLVATIHRAENAADPNLLRMIVNSLASSSRHVLLLAHPRLRARASERGIALEGGSLQLHDPQLIGAVLGNTGVVTDSGGLQKEALLLRVPCTTIRTETEWVETVDLGWNELANSEDAILRAIERHAPAATEVAPYSRGDAAKLAVAAILDRFDRG